MVWPQIASAPSALWALAFGASLCAATSTSGTTSSWQKPPRDGAQTYCIRTRPTWGRNLDERGGHLLDPLHDVDEQKRLHALHRRRPLRRILAHRQPEHVQSDLLLCEPDSRA